MFDLRPRHHGDAVAIADQQVAQCDRQAAQADRRADFARSVLERAVGGEAAAEDRQADLLQPREIAHEAIGDHGGDAEILRDRGDVAADHDRLPMVARA